MGIVPVIDFSPFLDAGATDAQRLATAQEVLTAAKDVGFFMLAGHGVETKLVADAFAMTQKFFALPRETKDALAWETPESNRGYVSQGRERVTQATDAAEIAALRAAAPDLKETMEIGKDYDSVYSNQWPVEAECPGFKEFMNAFFARMHALHVKIMQSLALASDLGENYFDKLIDGQAHNLRLLNYPSVDAKLHAMGSRAGAHSDYGSVTLLWQDSVGGLEVQNKEGAFIPAAPVEGTVVVNIGDMLQRWSNDVLRSTIHRVVMPLSDGQAMTPRRNSIAFFSNPNLNATIQCLPMAGVGEPKYEPVECEAYLVKRLSETYT